MPAALQFHSRTFSEEITRAIIEVLMMIIWKRKYTHYEG